jgi:mannose-6-phosphate isomerase-like protein (cupin superfamily)
MKWTTNYRDHVGVGTGKHHKATLFRSERLLLGLNCLEPGQSQAVHTHADQDKFYLVEEGSGTFTVGDEVFEAGVGQVIWAPAGVDHGVRNEGSDRLVLVVGIAPGPTP